MHQRGTIRSADDALRIIDSGFIRLYEMARCRARP